MQRVTRFNPAAVIGHSLLDIYAYVDDPTRSYGGHPYPETNFSARPQSAVSSKMVVDFSSDNMTVRQAVAAVPGLQHIPQATSWSQSNSGAFDVRGVSYEVVMQMVAALARVGVVFDHELLNQQAAVLNSKVVSPDVQQAYDAFLVAANGFLARIEQLSIPCLAKAGGIRGVTSPFRARALRHQFTGVFVTPDPTHANYVRIEVRGGMPLNDVISIRDAAFDFYEPLGVRVHFVVME